ncbi:MAG TPA: hypothetical protein VGP82_20890 [Ktedonobacterales bacterium]|nr:hypothetical protein [Ktedonobacterales bacterium]
MVEAREQRLAGLDGLLSLLAVEEHNVTGCYQRGFGRQAGVARGEQGHDMIGRLTCPIGSRV